MPGVDVSGSDSAGPLKVWLDRQCRSSRAAFGLLLVLSAILASYLVVWSFGYDNSLRQRAIDGLRNACVAFGGDISAIAPQTVRKTEGVTSDDWIVIDDKMTFCTVARLKAWLTLPCSGNVDGNAGSCPSWKNHVRACLRDFKNGAGAEVVVEEPVSFPVIGVRLGVIDLILLSPVFILALFLWINLSLKNVFQSLLDLSRHDVPGNRMLHLTLPSDLVLSHPSRGSRVRFFVRFVSCYLPFVVLLGVIASDLSDVFWRANPKFPNASMTIYQWLALSPSEDYTNGLWVREGFMIACTALVAWSGYKTARLSRGIRDLACFHALRGGLQSYFVGRVREAAKQVMGREVLTQRPSVQLIKPTKKRDFCAVHKWTIRHLVDAACATGEFRDDDDTGRSDKTQNPTRWNSVAAEVLMPRLDQLDWQSDIGDTKSIDDIAKQDAPTFAEYRNRLYSQIKMTVEEQWATLRRNIDPAQTAAPATPTNAGATQPTRGTTRGKRR